MIRKKVPNDSDPVENVLHDLERVHEANAHVRDALHDLAQCMRDHTFPKGDIAAVVKFVESILGHHWDEESMNTMIKNGVAAYKEALLRLKKAPRRSKKARRS